MARKKDYSKLSKDELIQLVEKLERKKKYGLVWDAERVPEQVVLDCKNNLPVLVEVKEKEIFTSDDEPTHILIEGDNYHALSVLNYTHQGRIDLIYIDPPYNSGKKDWKYNNRFVDDKDTWRHSKWIQFMYNRLSVAHDLLAPDGALVCAIDHNEQENLGILLRELFPDREITCVTIIHNPGGIQGDNFSYTNEFAYFVFPKRKHFIGRKKRPDVTPVPLRDWGGEESKRAVGGNTFYPIYVEGDEIVEFGDVCDDDFHPTSSNVIQNDGRIAIFPVDGNGVERKWRHARQSVESIREQLQCERSNGELVIINYKDLYRYKTVWTDKKYNSNTFGSKLLNKIVDSKFPFPKSLYNVKECLEATVYSKKNAIILDFFAGSGTTGHATMLLNKEDGGRRTAILCTNNEGEIASEITYPRISKIMNGYSQLGQTETVLLEKDITWSNFRNSDQIIEELNRIKTERSVEFSEFKTTIEDGILQLIGKTARSSSVSGFGNNLKYFQTAFVLNGDNKDQVRIDITHQCTEMLCLREGIYRELRKGTDWRIFEKGNRFLAVYYNFVSGTLDELRIEMNALEGDKVLYCFSVDPQGLVRSDFADWKDIRLEPIPQKILDIYKQLFNGDK